MLHAEAMQLLLIAFYCPASEPDECYWLAGRGKSLCWAL